MIRIIKIICSTGVCLSLIWTAAVLIFAGDEDALLLAGYGIEGVFFFGIAGLCHSMLSKYWKDYFEKIIRNEEYEALENEKGWKGFPEHEQLVVIIKNMVGQAYKRQSEENYKKQITLLALESQINPHFLYNTLDCIRGQALLDGNEKTAAMLEVLGDFFHYNISRKERMVTIQDEVSGIKNYMKIQQWRFHDKYTLEIQSDDEEIWQFKMPKMTLQPIVENALTHAFQKQKSGNVKVLLEDAGDIIIITVSDDGCGIEEDKLTELNKFIHGNGIGKQNPAKGNGIALNNVNTNIQTVFGNEYGLTIYSTAGRGTDVEITLPKTDE